jgi:hypothetical protein
MREKAKLCGLSEDLIDFDAYLDPALSWQENLAVFYREYPQLAEQSDYLKLSHQSDKGHVRDYANFSKNCGVKLESKSLESKEMGGVVSFPLDRSGEKPLIAVANTGQTLTELPSPEPSVLPTLSFNFTQQIVSEIPETQPNISTKLDPTTLAPIAAESSVPVSRFKDHVNTCTHFLIIGDKGKGKTALGCSILDTHHAKTARQCFVYRPPRPELFPDWVKPISNLDDLPQGGVCLIDEASRQFDQYSCRNPGNRNLAEKMRIARQNNQSIILIAHASSIVNQNLVLPIDVYLLKEPTKFQRFAERPMIREAYKEIKEPIQKNEYYWFDTETFEKETFTKPEWFSEQLSTAYAGPLPVTQTPAPPSTLPRVATPAAPRSQRFIQPFKAAPKNTGVRFSRAPRLSGLLTFRRPKIATPYLNGGFDSNGLILAAIIGTFGLISFLKGAWGIAAASLALATAGLVFSHNHFG